MTEKYHSLIEVLGVVVPILVYLMASKRSAKRDMERRHKENQSKLDEIVTEREYLPPHGHIEEEGPLMAEGIIRKKTKEKHS